MAKESKRSRKSKIKNHTRKNICNPNARKNKVSKDSCFTPTALELLKVFYNKEHPGRPIKETHPKNILREMKLKTNRECQEDSCLINKFATTMRDKKMLKILLYPPPKPSEWDRKNTKVDEDIWLSDADIKDVLNQYEQAYSHFAFIGPSPIDYDTRLKDDNCVCPKLCSIDIKKYLQPPTGKAPITKIGIVFNLDPHYKGGSHWVALFVDMEHDFIFYFDSTATRIPKLIHQLVKHIQMQGLSLVNPKHFVFHENTITEHQKSNTECGMYCLYFIITMLLREKEINYHDTTKPNTMTTEELFSLFKGGKKGDRKKTRIPDKLVFKKRNEYFSVS